MEPMKQNYKNLAEKIIANLAKRQMEGYYCETSQEAKELALSFAQPGMTVSNGGSVTLEDIGVVDGLTAKEGVTFIDRRTGKSPEETMELLRQGLTVDCYYMSTNAITLDGQLVNIDGMGGRTAALIFGPKNVVIVAGMNKVATDVDSAIKRVKLQAAPPNAVRLGRQVPCAVTGSCADCQSPGCICCNTVVTRRGMIPGRIKVILVGEELGY